MYRQQAGNSYCLYMMLACCLYAICTQHCCDTPPYLVDKFMTPGKLKKNKETKRRLIVRDRYDMNTSTFEVLSFVIQVSKYI
jgi:hypothetical protein